VGSSRDGKLDALHVLELSVDARRWKRVYKTRALAVCIIYLFMQRYLLFSMLNDCPYLSSFTGRMVQFSG